MYENDKYKWNYLSETFDFDNFTMPMQFKYSFVCHLWSTFRTSLPAKAMDTEIEKQKRKPRKIIKRKSVRRARLNHVEEVTAKVGGLKVVEADAAADVIEATRSQPQSRRASSVLMPAEVSRRAYCIVLYCTVLYRCPGERLLPTPPSWRP